MTRKFAVRILAGALLITASVLMITLVYKPEMAPLARILVAGAFASLAFGGLAAIFGGWRGFLYGACIGTGLAALEGLDQVLKQPLSGIVTIAILALMVFAPTLIMRLGRHANPGANDEAPEETEPPSSEETDALLLRYGLWVYQYLRDDEKIYIARIMSLSDPDNRHPILRSSGDYTSARGNSILRVSNLSGIQRHKRVDAVYIRLRRRDKGFTPWYEVMSENISEADFQIAKVFAGIPMEWKADEAPKQNAISRLFFRFFPNLRKEARGKLTLAD